MKNCRSSLADRAPDGLCLAALTWSYAITGPARGAVMSIMMLVLAYGMFALRPSDARRVALLGFGMLSFVMVYKALLADQRYDPHVELVHFAFAAIVTGVSRCSPTGSGRCVGT